MVRKGGLEPPRYRYRQPLKLADLLCCPELTRILRTEVGLERAEANASDDSIRTNSHTPTGHLLGAGLGTKVDRRAPPKISRMTRRSRSGSGIVSGRKTLPVSVTSIDPVERRVAAAPAQTISPERAASFVASDMWLDYGTGLCQPDRFDRALAARVREVSNVKIRHCLTMRPRAALDADPEGEHVHAFSLHFSGYDRKKPDEGRCHYIPVNLGEIPDYYRRFMAPSDIVVFKTCPVDEDGYFNLSAANLWHRAIIERSRMIIVETNERLPHVCGEGTSLHISEVDYVIEGTDDAPAPELPNPPVREVDAAVGRLIASEIEDGDCLQIGIGAMPNAVCTLLVDSGVRDLGVHTEMMTDGLA